MIEFITHRKQDNRKFSGTDTEKLFRKNKKRQPKDWIYHNKEINYVYNDQGFREKPFKEIDWKESVVVFGCSNIEGTGLAEEDTLVRQLEKIIERPVVNLGVGGTGVDLACWNSTTLHTYYPKPKAVIQIWSSFDRYMNKLRDRYQSCLANLPGYDYKLNWEDRSIRYVLTDRQMWENDTIYIENSFFRYTKNITQSLKLEKSFQIIDFARDLGHPGIKSNRLAAEELAKVLETHKI